MKHFTIRFALLACSFLPVLQACTPQKSPTFDWETAATVPDYPMPQGVSAPYSGFIGNRLVVAGGCNFPDVPAADGGKKVFYAETYSFADAPEGGWEAQPNLPEALAYGASVETPEGLLCIGGQGSNGPSARVFMLQEADGKLECRSFPSLPVPIDNGGAACIGRKVYVTGGNQATAESEDSGRGLYVLDLDQPTAWHRLADYPGHRRIQPVVLADSTHLYLIGGFEHRKTDNTCLMANSLLRFCPKDGEWQPAGDLLPLTDGTPRGLVGGTGVSDGKTFYITGGVNPSIFKAAVEGKGPEDYMRKPIDWYRFNSDIITYTPAQPTATQHGKAENLAESGAAQQHIRPNVPGMARAGGILVRRNDSLIMVCGELKPGIRTPLICVTHIK